MGRGVLKGGERKLFGEIDPEGAIGCAQADRSLQSLSALLLVGLLRG